MNAKKSKRILIGRRTRNFLKHTTLYVISGFGNFIKSRNGRLVLILVGLFVVASFLLFWVLTPNSKSVQAPVVVGSCDCDSLPQLSVQILDKKKIRVTAIFEHCIDSTWDDIRLQAPDDAENVDVELEQTKAVDIDGPLLSATVKNIRDSLRDGAYFKLSKEFLFRHFDTIKNARISLSYTTTEGIYRKSFNKYFLSILFIPVNTRKRDQNYAVTADILSPQSFLLTSSIPAAYKIFLLNDGINYTVSILPERTGMLLNFDDLEAEAGRETIILLASTILGFVLGAALEKLIIAK